MSDPFDAKIVAIQLDDLFFCEVIPCWSVFVTETGQEICAFRLQNSVDTSDKGCSVPCFYVMETAHIKDKLKPVILEGKRQKASYKKFISTPSLLALSLANFTAPSEMSMAVTSNPFFARYMGFVPAPQQRSKVLLGLTRPDSTSSTKLFLGLPSSHGRDSER